MSVSTTKPQLNTGNEQNDINDPVVQDVLNEFREELLSSKNKYENFTKQIEANGNTQNYIFIYSKFETNQKQQ